MTTNSQLSTTESKNHKLSKQPEQVLNHRYRDHLEGYYLRGEKGRTGEKVQGFRSIICRYKIDRDRLRTIYEIEKPKDLYAQPMDMN